MIPRGAGGSLGVMTLACMDQRRCNALLGREVSSVTTHQRRTAANDNAEDQEQAEEGCGSRDVPKVLRLLGLLLLNSFEPPCQPCCIDGLMSLSRNHLAGILIKQVSPPRIGGGLSVPDNANDHSSPTSPWTWEIENWSSDLEFFQSMPLT